MGNRAVITASQAFSIKGSSAIGIYLHWNGGRDSVEAFLTYCKLQGFRSPESDNYGWARLCQVIANFFDGGLSIGIDKCYNLDCENGDNGVYVIEKWDIVDRKYFKGREQQNYDLTEMLLEIDKAQPANMQLGADFINAPIVSTEELKVGDIVFIQEYNGRYEKFEIVGTGEDKVVNGQNVLNILFVNKYSKDGNFSFNINNYLLEKEYRVLK